MSSTIRPACINQDLDRLRREVCEEYDEMFRRIGVKKRMTLSKADIVIGLKIQKLREFEARNYGIKK